MAQFNKLSVIACSKLQDSCIFHRICHSSVRIIRLRSCCSVCVQLQGGPTEIRLNLTGFHRHDRRVPHAVQIHEFGDLSNGCRSAGGHYNPFDVRRGSASDKPQFEWVTSGLQSLSIKEGLYRIQILCRRYPFWSYPAWLTIADPPG